jgi:ATP-dependent HslUV protease subunit HslV
MSVIIAVKKAGRFVLVGDSLFEKAGLHMTSENKVNHKKLYIVRDSYVGLVGPAVNHNIFESILLRHGRLLSFKDRFEIFETMRKLHPILKEEYHINPSTDDDESAESSQLDLLVVNQRGIFEVENHREVNEYSRFWAIGSGSKFALGALHATYENLDDIDEIAIGALRSACALDPACGLPFDKYSSGIERVAKVRGTRSQSVPSPRSTPRLAS